MRRAGRVPAIGPSPPPSAPIRARAHTRLPLAFSSTRANTSRSAFGTPANISLRTCAASRQISSSNGLALGVRYSLRARRSAGSLRRSMSLSSSMRLSSRTIIIGSTSVSSREPRLARALGALQMHQRLALHQRERQRARMRFETRHVAAADVLEQEAEILQAVHGYSGLYHII